MAEFLVGCLDLERLQGEAQTADDVNARGLDSCGDAWRAVTDEELARIRTLARELVARWLALPPDGELRVTLPEGR